MHRALLITHHAPPLRAHKTLLLHAARPCPSLHPPLLCSFLSLSMSSHAPSTACTASATAGVATRSEDDPLVMYIVLRRDLWQEQQWPLGSIVSQGCHAATAALWDTRDAPSTQAYCAANNIDNMRKVCSGSITYCSSYHTRRSPWRSRQSHSCTHWLASSRRLGCRTNCGLSSPKTMRRVWRRPRRHGASCSRS